MENIEDLKNEISVLEEELKHKQIKLTEQLNRTKSLILSSSLPTLTMSGLYQYANLSNNFDFANYSWFPYSVVGFSLQVPITSWASTHYKLKQTDLTIQNI